MSASSVSLSRSQLPAGDVLVMLVVVVTGFGAASIAEPMMWYLTPVVLACLVLASRQGALRATDEMPAELRARLDATLSAIPTGEIRALYSDVIAAATPVFSGRMRRLSDHYARTTRDSVTELLEGASQVALDAARLETTLRAGTMLQRDPAVHASAEKARAQYARQLADVVTTLNALVASGLAHGTPESERVDELVSEIRNETTARTEAWREIDSFLA